MSTTPHDEFVHSILLVLTLQSYSLRFFYTHRPVSSFSVNLINQFRWEAMLGRSSRFNCLFDPPVVSLWWYIPCRAYSIMRIY